MILPRAQDAKCTAIKVAQNLNALTISLLKEKLQAYKSHLETASRDDVISKPKAKSSKKNITFKVVKEAEEIEI